MTVISKKTASLFLEKMICSWPKNCAGPEAITENSCVRFWFVLMLTLIYWWKEFDTYKVGITANSTSTMHKIHSKPFEINDFSHDQLDFPGMEVLKGLIAHLERLRESYNQTKNKAEWYRIIQLLPSSYNQFRTCTMTYENLVNIYRARKSHKLDEWKKYCEWIERLPYATELICSCAK